MHVLASWSVYTLFPPLCLILRLHKLYVMKKISNISNSADVVSPADVVCAAQGKPSTDALPVSDVPAGWCDVTTHRI